MTRIRTAVVGLNIGLKHANAYHRAEHADLRWVVDLDEEKAAKVAEELGCGYTTDWTSILDDVDAVSLCTPHHLHAPQALEAIAAGKHVLLEKPLANTEADCLNVIQAAEDEGVTLMLAYIVRYLPIIRRLKAVLDEGTYGQPISASCWVEGYLPPLPGTWFARKETLGGGVLFSHGCHYIDILMWLMGRPMKVAELGTRNGTDWLEGEGTSHSLMTFENGALGHLIVSWGMKVSSPPAKLHIHTPEALLILDNSMQRLEVVTAEGRQTLYEPSPKAPSQSGIDAIYEIEHFLHCIRTGQTPESDGHEALKSHRVIWAMEDHDGAAVIL